MRVAVLLHTELQTLPLAEGGWRQGLAAKPNARAVDRELHTREGGNPWRVPPMTGVFRLLDSFKFTGPVSINRLVRISREIRVRRAKFPTMSQNGQDLYGRRGSHDKSSRIEREREEEEEEEEKLFPDSDSSVTGRGIAGGERGGDDNRTFCWAPELKPLENPPGASTPSRRAGKASPSEPLTARRG